MSYSVGIDPGIQGALALLRGEVLVEVVDMPVVTVSKTKKQVNPAEVARIIRAWRRAASPTIYVESVASMPGQGVSSMFSFGVGFGMVQGVIAALDLPIVLVTPVSWKRRAGLLGKDKDMSRTLAQRLYPGAPLGRKKDVGRADAILIALYGEK